MCNEHCGYCESSAPTLVIEGYYHAAEPNTKGEVAYYSLICDDCYEQLVKDRAKAERGFALRSLWLAA